ncbi:MAG: exo-alpha-sialidase, partial [Actinomycetota bacterium]|nr:exo-alpha-sialidase [Actinomycetota bacterium]
MITRNFPARALGGLGALLLASILAVIIEQPISRAAPPASGVPPTWGTAIRVSPVFTTTPDAQVNYALAVNPVNPDRVLAGYDSYGPNAITSGYALSSDAGRTWTGDRFYDTWISNTMPSGNTSVGFDRAGTGYLVSQVLGQAATGYVVLTTTTGSTWSMPVPIALSDYSQYRSQAHLAVDARPSSPLAGSLYVAWRYFTTGPLGIRLRYSRDAGRTWSQDVLVSDVGNEAGEQPSIQVAGDGSIYTAFGANDTNLYLDRSTDGGVTWGTDQAITGGPITPIGGLDAEGHELLLLGDSNGDGVVINNDPSIAVAASDPRTVYAVWNDGRWETDFTIYGHTGRHADVAFSRSTDAGVTWSAPIRLNDDPQGNGIDQWAPNIATGPDGRVGVTWNDRRDDPNHVLYARYYSESTDGGLTWSPNSPISAGSNSAVARFNGDGNGDMGDYGSLVYGPNYVLPAWIDTRAGLVQDFFVNRGTFTPATPTPVPSNTPTIVPSNTPTSVPSNTPTARPSATRTTVPSPSPTPCATQFS